MKEFTRRDFLKATGAGAVLVCVGCGGGSDSDGTVRFGVITDEHYGVLPDAPATPRFFQASLAKASAAVAEWNAQRVSFAVTCGDVLQQTTDGDVNKSYSWLKAIDDEFAKLKSPMYYVLGNHDVMEMSKEEFLSRTCSAIKDKYYYWDMGKYRFIVLDGDYTSDTIEYNAGNFDWKISWIPTAQKVWLIDTLQDAKSWGLEAVVFAHQNFQKVDNYNVQNSAAIREIFEQSGIVRVVFGGHRHVFSTVYTTKINGIYYAGLNVVVNQPENAYGIVTVSEDNIEIEGYGVQRNEILPR